MALSSLRSIPIEVDSPRDRIGQFVDRYGEAHLRLLCHAAFPLSLTPDLLHRLRASIQRSDGFSAPPIPWIAVSDILFASFCQPVGNNLYEFEHDIRCELLRFLREEPRYGESRLTELAELILSYSADLMLRQPAEQAFAGALDWGARAYLHSKATASELVKRIDYAREKDLNDLNRTAGIVQRLSDPLADYPMLLDYARGMARYARGDEEGATEYFQKLLSSSHRPSVEGIPLNFPDSLPLRFPDFDEVRSPVLKTPWHYYAASVALVAVSFASLSLAEPVRDRMRSLVPNPRSSNITELPVYNQSPQPLQEQPEGSIAVSLDPSLLPDGDNNEDSEIYREELTSSVENDLLDQYLFSESEPSINEISSDFLVSSDVSIVESYDEASTIETEYEAATSADILQNSTVDSELPIVSSFEEPISPVQSQPRQTEPLLPLVESTVDSELPIASSFKEPISPVQSQPRQTEPLLPLVESTVDSELPLASSFEEPISLVQSQPRQTEPLLPLVESTVDSELPIASSFEEPISPVQSQPRQTEPLLPLVESTVDSELPIASSFEEPISPVQSQPRQTEPLLPLVESTVDSELPIASSFEEPISPVQSQPRQTEPRLLDATSANELPIPRSSQGSIGPVQSQSDRRRLLESTVDSELPIAPSLEEPFSSVQPQLQRTELSETLVESSSGSLSSTVLRNLRESAPRTTRQAFQPSEPSDFSDPVSRTTTAFPISGQQRVASSFPTSVPQRISSAFPSNSYSYSGPSSSNSYSYSYSGPSSSNSYSYSYSGPSSSYSYSSPSSSYSYSYPGGITNINIPSGSGYTISIPSGSSQTINIPSGSSYTISISSIQSDVRRTINQVNSIRRDVDFIESQVINRRRGRGRSDDWRQLSERLDTINREYRRAERSLENAIRQIESVQRNAVSQSDLWQRDKTYRDIEELAAELATLNGRRYSFQQRMPDF